MNIHVLLICIVIFIILLLLNLIINKFCFTIIKKKVNSANFSDYQNKSIYKTSLIPNVIYTYWNHTTIPKFVQKCINSWKRHNPSYKIIIINQDNIKDYIPIDVLKLKHAKTHQKIADFIRMIILKNHGGIWLDASLYLNIPLDWIHWYQITNQSEYVGYKIRSCGVRHKRNNKIPIVENWFMACVPNSKFISDWCVKFLEINNYEKVKDYVKHIKSSTDISGIDGPVYLSMHISCLYILQNSNYNYKISLLQAKTGPYLYLNSMNWQNLFLVPFLKYYKGKESPIIKYCGGQRNSIIKNKLEYLFD